jgi:hypothetical protein
VTGAAVVLVVGALPMVPTLPPLPAPTTIGGIVATLSGINGGGRGE